MTSTAVNLPERNLADLYRESDEKDWEATRNLLKGLEMFPRYPRLDALEEIPERFF